MKSAGLTSGPANTLRVWLARALTDEVRKTQSVKSFCRAVISFTSFRGASMELKRVEGAGEVSRLSSISDFSG